jgi:hypothetical protein
MILRARVLRVRDNLQVPDNLQAAQSLRVMAARATEKMGSVVQTRLLRTRMPVLLAMGRAVGLVALTNGADPVEAEARARVVRWVPGLAWASSPDADSFRKIAPRIQGGNGQDALISTAICVRSRAATSTARVETRPAT